MNRQLRNNKRVAAILLFAVVGVLTDVPAAFGQLPTTRLVSIFPSGGTAGSDVQVRVSGSDLDDLDRLVFSHSGIQAKPIMAPPHEFDDTPRPVPNRFVVTVAGDVPPGIYTVRAVGRFGASNPRAFAVNTLKGVVEDDIKTSGENDEPQRAIPIELDTVVHGRVAQDRIDYFRFAAKAGDRLLASCVGREIDSRIDSTLLFLDSRGRELTRILHGNGPDAVGAIEIPEDGEYVVGVYDFVYRGGDDYGYQLLLNRRPHIDAIFPPSGLPGSTSKYTLYGRNLPGGTPATNAADDAGDLQTVSIDLSLPKDENRQVTQAGFRGASGAGIDGHLFRWQSPGGPSNGVLIEYAQAPVIAEMEPNNAPSEAQVVALPCEVVGRFGIRNDYDWVQFDAKQGEAIWIDVISHRSGRDTDARLLVQKVTGAGGESESVEKVAEVDEAVPFDFNKPGLVFDPRSKDPSYLLKVTSDATYRVRLEDLYHSSRGDPRMLYRLVLTRAKPDFQVVAYSNPPSQDKNQINTSALVLRRGGTAALKLHLFSLYGFQGEVQVTADGLPPGVSCHGTIVGGGRAKASLVFAATDNCAAFTGPIRIVARATVDGQEVTRQARASALVWSTKNPQQDRPMSRLVDQLWLSVMDKETAPASVQVGDGQVVETSLGGKVKLPVKVTRRGDFKAAVKLKATGLPATSNQKELNVTGGDGEYELALTDRKLPPGAYTIYLSGTVKFKHARNPDAIPAAEAEQKKIDKIRQDMEARAKAAAQAMNTAAQQAQQMADRLKQAQQTLSTAQREAQAAEQAQKQAEARLKNAREAAQREPDKAALAEQTKTAEAAANDARAKNEQAQAKLATAQAELTARQQDQQTAEAAKQDAQQAATEATEKKNKADALKRKADEKLTAVKSANQPKDVNLAIVSTPVRLRVAAAPVDLTVRGPQGTVRQGEKTEVVVAVQRKYGFADAVVLRLDPPQGISGLPAAQVNVEKNAGEGSLALNIGGQVPPGEHLCKITARMKFNGVDVVATDTVALKIEPAPKTE